MKDEIIEMAREAGYGDAMAELHAPALERFYNLAVQREREDIAKMFDEPMHLIPFVQNHLGGCVICGFTPKMAADHIRARGEKQ